MAIPLHHILPLPDKRQQVTQDGLRDEKLRSAEASNPSNQTPVGAPGRVLVSRPTDPRLRVSTVVRPDPDGSRDKQREPAGTRSTFHVEAGGKGREERLDRGRDKQPGSAEIRASSGPSSTPHVEARTKRSEKRLDRGRDKQPEPAATAIPSSCDSSSTSPVEAKHREQRLDASRVEEPQSSAASKVLRVSPPPSACPSHDARPTSAPNVPVKVDHDDGHLDGGRDVEPAQGCWSPMLVELRCHLCGKTFPSWDQLRHHAVATHWQYKERKGGGRMCVLCLEEVKECQREQHMREHARASYHCPYCMASFLSGGKACQHVLWCHVASAPLCDGCGAQFPDMWVLFNHRREALLQHQRLQSASDPA